MGTPFEIRREATVDAIPEQIWQAIATGPGIDSWFVGTTEVDAGKSMKTAFGGCGPEHTVTAWEPGQRRAYQDSGTGGRFVTYEFLAERRSGGATVLRTVTSGLLPGDDWADESEAMGHELSRFWVILGVGDHADRQHLAVRTGGALLRFMHGFHGPPVARHHLVDSDATDWAAWLTDISREH